MGTAVYTAYELKLSPRNEASLLGSDPMHCLAPHLT